MPAPGADGRCADPPGAWGLVGNLPLSDSGGRELARLLQSTSSGIEALGVPGLSVLARAGWLFAGVPLSRQLLGFLHGLVVGEGRQRDVG